MVLERLLDLILLPLAVSHSAVAVVTALFRVASCFSKPQSKPWLFAIYCILLAFSASLLKVVIVGFGQSPPRHYIQPMYLELPYLTMGCC
ncbi:hypothetical protein B0O99DRAFT_638220 [Bisporella sp. PMI_857]|nr:hypothetical protein B0O99DRAFT_638220 [Bisporella sp. PMI_857]